MFWFQEYQKVVDAEWGILYDKLEKIVASGAKVVLSKLPIGDVATQYFADRSHLSLILYYLLIFFLLLLPPRLLLLPHYLFLLPHILLLLLFTLPLLSSRDVFCAGRVPEEDLRRTMQACGGAIQTSVSSLSDSALGTCQLFEEEQIGGERWV